MFCWVQGVDVLGDSNDHVGLVKQQRGYFTGTITGMRCCGAGAAPKMGISRDTEESLASMVPARKQLEECVCCCSGMPELLYKPACPRMPARFHGQCMGVQPMG